MNAREQRLALGFVAIVVLGGAFVGFKQLTKWRHGLDQKEIEVDARRIEADALMSQRDFWDQRSDFLSSEQPEYTNRKDADVNLLKTIQDSSDAHKVKITRNQPTEPIEINGLKAATVVVEASGDLKAVMEWLYELQKPTSFVQIPAITIRPNDETPSEVFVNMNLEKWFRVPVEPPAS